MIGVGLFGILLTPVFFYVIMRFRSDRRTGADASRSIGHSGQRIPRRCPSHTKWCGQGGAATSPRTADQDSSSSQLVPTGQDGQDEVK